MSDKCETFVARWDHAMCSTCGAAHAPTPTPAPGLDLDAVERAERAMTPGEWRADFTYVTAAGGPVATCIGPDAEHDAAGIVALRNAAPAIAALADECERLRGTVSALDLKVSDAEQSHMAAIATERRRREAVEIERDGAALDRRRHFALYTREHEINATLTTRIATLEAELVQARAHQCGGIRAGTVGGLLATAPVGSIVEFWHGATANQITTRVGGIDDRVWLWRYRNPNGEWSPWDYEAPSPDDLSQPGEIVPADPNQRGPLPKGG